MLDVIQEIKYEHLHINKVLSQIDFLIEKGSSRETGSLIDLFNNLSDFWNKHEIKEKQVFNFVKRHYHQHPGEIMIIGQHKELRGHWKVITQAIESNNLDKIVVVFDTDGRMLIEKFRKHMNQEEKFFKEFEHLKIKNKF